MRDLPWKAWLAIVVAATVLLLTLSWCDGRRKLETARDQNTIADGRTASAVEAINAIGDNAAFDTETQLEVKDALDAINDETDPAVRDAVARRELCILQGGSAC